MWCLYGAADSAGALAPASLAVPSLAVRWLHHITTVLITTAPRSPTDLAIHRTARTAATQPRTAPAGTSPTIRQPARSSATTARAILAHNRDARNENGPKGPPLGGPFCLFDSQSAIIPDLHCIGYHSSCL